MENKCVNNGIECKVCDCKYHSEHNCCTAPKITVGPDHATCSADTTCVTFKPAESCKNCK